VVTIERSGTLSVYCVSDNGRSTIVGPPFAAFQIQKVQCLHHIHLRSNASLSLFSSVPLSNTITSNAVSVEFDARLIGVRLKENVVGIYPLCDSRRSEGKSPQSASTSSSASVPSSGDVSDSDSAPNVSIAFPFESTSKTTILRLQLISFAPSLPNTQRNAVLVVGLSSGELFVVNAHTGKIVHHLFGPTADDLHEHNNDVDDWRCSQSTNRLVMYHFGSTANPPNCQPHLPHLLRRAAESGRPLTEPSNEAPHYVVRVIRNRSKPISAVTFLPFTSVTAGGMVGATKLHAHRTVTPTGVAAPLTLPHPSATFGSESDSQFVNVIDILSGKISKPFQPSLLLSDFDMPSTNVMISGVWIYQFLSASPPPPIASQPSGKPKKLSVSPHKFYVITSVDRIAETADSNEAFNEFGGLISTDMSGRSTTLLDDRTALSSSRILHLDWNARDACASVLLGGLSRRVVSIALDRVPAPTIAYTFSGFNQEPVHSVRGDRLRLCLLNLTRNSVTFRTAPITPSVPSMAYTFESESTNGSKYGAVAISTSDVNHIGGGVAMSGRLVVIPYQNEIVRLYNFSPASKSMGRIDPRIHFSIGDMAVVPPVFCGEIVGIEGTFIRLHTMWTTPPSTPSVSSKASKNGSKRAAVTHA